MLLRECWGLAAWLRWPPLSSRTPCVCVLRVQQILLLPILLLLLAAANTAAANTATASACCCQYCHNYGCCYYAFAFRSAETSVVTTTEKKWREGMNEVGEISVAASASAGDVLPSLGAPARVLNDVSNTRTVSRWEGSSRVTVSALCPRQEWQGYWRGQGARAGPFILITEVSGSAS